MKATIKMSVLNMSLIAAAIIAAGCDNSIEFKANETALVRGNDVSAEFAVKEFNEIGKKATGKTIAEGIDAKHKIFIGRSSEVEKRLGKEFLDGLKDEESVVMQKDGDLFLVGGGDLGTLYAVYDFMEDNLGFRHYFNRDVGGDTIKKADEIRFTGKATRKRPAFTGYRKNHSGRKGTELFMTRNRDNVYAEKVVKNYSYKYANRTSGHGFLLFLSVKDLFKAHPEYFTLTKEGKRTDRVQMCMSNPGLRKVLTEAIFKRIEKKGNGVYMVGENDGTWNKRFCYCKDCLALEEKYGGIGGPIWDYLIYLCNEIKAKGYDKVYVQSLAYNGPYGTEIAPKKDIKFPDNLIIDVAYLNADRSLNDIADLTLNDGTVYNRYDNTKKWTECCSHVSYWYYGSTTPALAAPTRMKKEIRELRDLGVESVGACGIGGGYEFEDMTPYLYYLLLRNPDADAHAEFENMIKIKYGKAWEYVLTYVKELDATRKQYSDKKIALFGCDQIYDGYSFVSGKQLVRWQGLMDKAEAAVAGDEKTLTYVREARIGLDLCSIIFASKIKEECPGYKNDLQMISERVLASAAGYEERELKPHRRKNVVPQYVSEMGNYPNLKSEELPDELKKYPKGKVHRMLPPLRKKVECWGVCGKWTSTPDPDAVCGHAIVDVIPDSLDCRKKGGIIFEHFDKNNLVAIRMAENRRVPLNFLEKGKYKLWRVGKSTVASRSAFVTGGMWASPLATGMLSRCYDPSYANKEFEIWVSIKAEGPMFFKGDTGENKIYIEQYFAVDLGVPEEN